MDGLNQSINNYIVYWMDFFNGKLFVVFILILQYHVKFSPCMDLNLES
jgi:hypothetical protein